MAVFGKCCILSIKGRHVLRNSFPQPPPVATDMNASFDLNVTRADTEDIFYVVNGIRESPLIYTLTAVAFAALVLSGFENGRKVFQRIAWFLEGILGGAPHTITLPGPSGLPLVGNLNHVSFSWKSSLLGSSDRFF